MINKAKDFLSDSCFALINEDKVFLSNEKGVKTLLKLLKENPKLLNGAVVADKVVGKGAAFLFVKGQVKEIYAKVISESAVCVLEKYNVKFSYSELVKNIINNKGTGICPIESLCLSVEDFEIAYEKITKFFEK